MPRHIRPMLAGAALALAATAPLPAAAQAPLFDWTGVYAGVNAGAGFLRSKMDSGYCTTGNTCYFAGYGSTGTGRLTNAGDYRKPATWAAFGGQVGYNYQVGPVVLGAEADVDVFRGKVRRSSHTSFSPTTTTLGADTSDSLRNSALVTLRGRIGYAYEDLGMVYLTGGLAWANFQRRSSYGEFGFGPGGPCGGNNIFANYCASNNFGQRLGYAVGGGVEAPVWGGFSVKAEYLFVDFGEKANTVPLMNGNNTAAVLAPSSGPAANQRAQSVTQNFGAFVHMFRIGVNYSF